MRIKVCGMTQLEQVEQLAEHGCNIRGVYFLSKIAAVCVQRDMTTGQIKKKNKLNKVGVFVNASC